ncbi:MAG: ATP-dependent Clp protease adapter ClpS [Actinomycetaceae bacterium]|nr:ATP-dependent Clp protease adapter ClpS [Actinomycetaceae bacterium]
MAPHSLTAERPETQTRERPLAGAEWTTVVWDDPVNLMTYVTQVFQRHFGYSHQRAYTLMMQVHTQGRANVSRGQRERMEADVMAMHSYGLKATLEQATGK